MKDVSFAQECYHSVMKGINGDWTHNVWFTRTMPYHLATTHVLMLFSSCALLLFYIYDTTSCSWINLWFTRPTMDSHYQLFNVIFHSFLPDINWLKTGIKALPMAWNSSSTLMKRDLIAHKCHHHCPERHGWGLNTWSLVYETNTLPLGHHACNETP